MRLNFLKSMTALLIGLALSLLLAAACGEDPWLVLTVLVHGAFATATGFGYALFYATPLLFTGLSVAWAFRAGLFNIGGEGQMALGGVALAAVGILAPSLNPWLALPLGTLAAFLAGGAWGTIAGWIKAKRGCHEVLTTILLNFVAYGLVSFFVLIVFKNPNSQVPETAPVGPGYEIRALPEWLSGTSPANWSLVFGSALVLLYSYIMRETKLGFHQRMTGSAPELGRRSGLNITKQTVIAMFISGGIAALGALSPVLGFALKTHEGFTSGAGFIGIAVALLGGGSAFGLIAAALLFGILTKGAMDLDFDTEFVSRDLATVIEALIILAIACQAGIFATFAKWKNRRVS